MSLIAPFHVRLAMMVFAATIAASVRATVQDPVDDSVREFLARDDGQHAYRAFRRLEAENGARKGWVDAMTKYAPQIGFQYEITAEGGSSYIRDKVLRAVLDGERDLIAQGEAGRSALVRDNYSFQGHGGLANVLLSPKRKDGVLIAGTMFLQANGGDLVRLQGRLAKNPSFWVKNVEIVRRYERIAGVVLPVVLESNAEVRLLGTASLRMTYRYAEIDGHPVDHRGN